MPVEGREIAHPVETERLLLRAYEPGDLEAMLALHGDAERTQYVPFGPRSRQEVQGGLDRKMTQLELREPPNGVSLAMVVRAGGEFAGELTLSYESREHSTGEVGFMLPREQEGHGYATEGAREMLRIGFEELDFHRIIGRIDARNTASAAVLSRLGMRHEARLVDNEWIKGEWTTEDTYAMLEREWRERAGGS